MGLLFDLAQMTVSSAPGTASTIALGSANIVNGVTYLTFAQAGVTNGVVVDYSIQDPINGGVEIGTATYSSTGPQLTGRTPTKSSNSNAAINASIGSIVSCSPRAETLNDASVITTGTMVAARLGSGVIGAGLKALFDDQTFKTLAAIAQSGSASDLGSGTVPTARLGSGTASSTTALFGDQTYKAITTNGLVQINGGGAYYSSTQTITIPAGATRARVRLWGGTGSSGGTSGGSGAVTSQAGAGAGYLEKYLTSLTAGNTLALTVGAGGTAPSGNVNGNAGGNSSLASGTQTISTLTANGGAGGAKASLTVPNTNSGGTATGGDINITGQGAPLSVASDGTSLAGSSSGGMTGGGMSKGGDGVNSGGTTAGTVGIIGGCIIGWYS